MQDFQQESQTSPVCNISGAPVAYEHSPSSPSSCLGYQTASEQLDFETYTDYESYYSTSHGPSTLSIRGEEVSDTHMAMSVLAGQERSSNEITPLMPPPLIELQSDGLVGQCATNENLNFVTPSATKLKRPRECDESEQAATEAEEALRDIEKTIQAIAEEQVSAHNKKFKNCQIVTEVKLKILATDRSPVDAPTSDPVGTNDLGQPKSISRINQAQQVQQAQPLVRNVSSSTTVESQLPGLHSPKSRPADTQSVYSQTTVSTNPSPGRKACLHPDCCKTFRFFSQWKEHVWTKHYPQRHWVCLFCKVAPKFDQAGNLCWKCTSKNCETILSDQRSAVNHLVDHSGAGARSTYNSHQHWSDHLGKHGSGTLPCFKPRVISNQQLQCLLCDVVFDSNASHITDNCQAISTWVYNTSTPFPPRCGDHPGLVLDSVDKMNEHFQVVHFPKSDGSRGKSARSNEVDSVGVSSWGDNASEVGSIEEAGRSSRAGTAARGQIRRRRGRAGSQVHTYARASGMTRSILSSSFQIQSGSFLSPRPTPSGPYQHPLPLHNEAYTSQEQQVDRDAVLTGVELWETEHPPESQDILSDQRTSFPLIATGHEPPAIFFHPAG